MKIAVIGDMHKDFEKLKETLIYLKRHESITTVIQVGDLGLNGPFYSYLENLSSLLVILRINFYFIDGNYDNIDWLKSMSDNSYKEVMLYPNLYYMPRGSTLKLGDKKFFFCGGGYSANQKKRIEKINYWKNEILTEAEVVSIKEHYKDKQLNCDFFISHDTIDSFSHSLSYFPKWFGKWKWPQDVKHKEFLKELVELSGAKTIIHGHYHKQKEIAQNSLKNICLPNEKVEVTNRFILL